MLLLSMGGLFAPRFWRSRRTFSRRLSLHPTCVDRPWLRISKAVLGAESEQRAPQSVSRRARSSQQRTSTPTWLRCLLCRRSVCIGQPTTEYIQLMAAAATE